MIVTSATSNHAHIARAAGGKKPPQPVPDGDKGTEDAPDKATQRIVDRLISSPNFAGAALSKLGKNGELTISVNGGDVIKVRNTSPSFAQRIVDSAQAAITEVSQEASKIVEADPAFAFKEAALAVRTQVARGLPHQASAVINRGFLPMLRTASLILDTRKALGTYHNPDASTVDKVVDYAHLVTDVGGLVGSLGFDIVPALSGLAAPLTAVGLVGDIAAYSYHVLQYLRARGQVNLDANGGVQAPQSPAPSPPANPKNLQMKAA